MLDSLVRKFTKTNKDHHPSSNQHHLSYCSTSSFSSSLASTASNSPIDLNRNCVRLELFDLNDSCTQSKPSLLPEHIYEEIQENQQLNNNSNHQIIMLREELINEVLPPSSTSSLSSNKSSSSSSASSSSSSSCPS